MHICVRRAAYCHLICCDIDCMWSMTNLSAIPCKFFPVIDYSHFSQFITSPWTQNVNNYKTTTNLAENFLFKTIQYSTLYIHFFCFFKSTHSSTITWHYKKSESKTIQLGQWKKNLQLCRMRDYLCLTVTEKDKRFILKKVAALNTSSYLLSKHHQKVHVCNISVGKHASILSIKPQQS